MIIHSDMIETTTWQVGGNIWANIGTATVKNAYTNEIVSPATNTTYSAKIGLMYVSDYGYAASPDYWTTGLNAYYNAVNANWLYSNLGEWTITQYLDNPEGTYFVFMVIPTGNVTYNAVYGSYVGARPTFYLKSNVVLESGDGSIQNPYQLCYLDGMNVCISHGNGGGTAD